MCIADKTYLKAQCRRKYGLKNPPDAFWFFFYCCHLHFSSPKFQMCVVNSHLNNLPFFSILLKHFLNLLRHNWNFATWDGVCWILRSVIFHFSIFETYNQIFKFWNYPIGNLFPDTYLNFVTIHLKLITSFFYCVTKMS